MSYHKLWFNKTAQQFKVLQPLPEFHHAQTFIKANLPKLIDEMDSRGLDLRDPGNWWESLYIDAVIELENAEGQMFTIAVGIVDQWKPALAAHRIISSPKMMRFRETVGLDQHWLFYVTSRHPYSDDIWLDLLYEQIDQPVGNNRCILLEVDP